MRIVTTFSQFNCTQSNFCSIPPSNNQPHFSKSHIYSTHFKNSVYRMRITSNLSPFGNDKTSTKQHDGDTPNTSIHHARMPSNSTRIPHIFPRVNPKSATFQKNFSANFNAPDQILQNRASYIARISRIRPFQAKSELTKCLHKKGLTSCLQCAIIITSQGQGPNDTGPCPRWWWFTSSPHKRHFEKFTGEHPIGDSI